LFIALSSRPLIKDQLLAETKTLSIDDVPKVLLFSFCQATRNVRACGIGADVWMFCSRNVMESIAVGNTWKSQ